MKRAEINQKINDFISKFEFENFELSENLSADDFYEGITFDDLTDILDANGAFDVEIISYARAMEYLIENDCPLTESLKLASDMGYKPDNLSSEILASLLASERAREEWNDIESDWKEFLEELDQLNWEDE
jgi:hypothetical protein